MPACATRYAGSPPISRPRKRTEPALGRSAPAIRLKVVLFPEPFGPMRPRISPSATSKETFLTARKPSKLLVSPLTSSTYGAKAWPFGKGSTGSVVWISFGQAMRARPLTYCMTTGKARSFWPASGWPGG